MFVAVILALVTCLFNAVSAVIQRRVAGQPSIEELFRGNFMKNLTLNRVWIFGFLLQIGAFLAQAEALKLSSLVLVEPLLTIDLVFLILILHFKYKMPTGIKEWVGVTMICLGLGGLFVSANPHPGHLGFEVVRWVPALIPMVGVIAAAIYTVRRTLSRRKRASIAGVAAGVSFALVAMFTKLTVSHLNQGFLALLSNWPIYALLISGILAIVMTQNTYGAGPVAISQPIMEISEPIISVIMGMLLFGDSINLSEMSVALEIVTSLIVGYGIWLLSRSERLRVNKI